MAYIKVMLFYLIGLICGIFTLAMVVDPSKGWMAATASGIVTFFFFYVAGPALSSSVECVKDDEKEAPIIQEQPKNSALSTNASGRLIYQIPPVKKTAKGYILNPGTTFELTLLTDSETEAQTVRDLIDHYEHGTWLEKAPLAPILARCQLRCLEVDAYIKVHKKQFQDKVNELVNNSQEWSHASKSDQAYLMEKIIEKAISVLSVRLSTELAPLLEDLPNTAGLDAKIVDSYGQEAHTLYMLYAHEIGKTQKIHAVDQVVYQNFKKLVTAKLCLNGVNIPQAILLEQLSMTDLTEMITDCNLHEKAKNKADAISILGSGKNVMERLMSMLPVNELYYLIPPKGMEKKIADLQKSWCYYDALAKLMKTTYSIARTNTFKLITAPNALSGEKIRWEVKSCDDCSDCESLHILYEHTPPEPPLHVGCQCLIYWHHTAA
ncbi:MAG: hypothetical protein KAG53_11550 [Endozoicomonadaceae bacterium]|nr:hypothetical protein [Endozoicomonadaceae bacterium]